MFLAINICDLNWVPVFLSWLLPFLLGLLLGRMIWGAFKIRFYDQEKELLKYKERVAELDADLQTSQKSRTQLEAEAAILRGRVRELESSGLSTTTSQTKVVAAAKQPIQRQGPKQDESVPKEAFLSHFGAIAEDNLQVIEGIGPKVEEILKQNGVLSWSHLAQRSVEELQTILESEDPKLRIMDPSSWPFQAGLASKRAWAELVDFQRSIPSGSGAQDPASTKVEKWMIKAGIMKKYRQDDLKAIEGIGPKVAALLKAAGIDTWEKLAASSVEEIQSILDSGGDRFKFADPITWPIQAALAANGEWQELEALQEKLIGGKPPVGE